MKAFIIGLTIASLASPSMAGSAKQSLSIKTSDLDLASENGQKVLSLRIHRAAQTLCTSDALEQLPSMQRAEQKCIKEAKASTIAAVDRKAGVRAANR
jgi:UrcA family protein